MKCWIVASRCCGVIPPSKRQIWESEYNDVATLTLKPARWRRKAMMSRKETNWELMVSRENCSKAYKTRDLIVQSCFRSLSSSSTSASSFDEERHLSTSSRERIP